MFEESIKQKRLKLFFDYLLKNSISIHFDIVHILHLSIVDILDSLIDEADIYQDIALSYYKNLQSDLMEALYVDYQTTHNFLCRYCYPDVPISKANDFIKELYTIYLNNLSYFSKNDEFYFTKELLRQLIKAKIKKNKLYFLEDNKPFQVYEDLHQNYFLRMLEIKDQKYFDNEYSVSKYLYSLDEKCESKLKIAFVDSKDSREIQISDVICGFVARLYNFLSHNDYSSIVKYILSLDNASNELETLRIFFELMTISDNLSHVMFKKVTPLFIERRFQLMVSLVEKKSAESK